MLDVNGTTISLTRGDTAQISVGMVDVNGDEYTPQEGDVVRFAVKHRYTDTHPVISKVVPNDTMMLVISPEDTKPLIFGEYVYDMQITYADGQVDTFIDRASLVILEEVD